MLDDDTTIDLSVSEKLALGLAEQRVVDDHTRESRLQKFIEYLRAGNRSKAFGILTKKACGAKRAHLHLRCLARPKHNGRCKWHGGGTPTPGPTTAAGIERCREAQLRRWAKFRAEKAAAELFAD